MVDRMSANLLDPEEAEIFVSEQFADYPERLRHILVVAERVRQSARDINELNPGFNIDETLAYCAGLVHDIGYLEDIADTGFHPLDGYRFLLRSGFPELARRIVGHGCAIEEAELLGITLPEGIDDLIARLITYWDMQVRTGGEIAGYEIRLRDVLTQYGEDSLIGRANRCARPRIEQIIEQINRLLGNIPA